MKKNKQLIAPLRIEELIQNSQSKYLKELKIRSNHKPAATPEPTNQNNGAITTQSINQDEDFHFLYNNENLAQKGELALWKAVILQALIDLQSKSLKGIAQTYRLKAMFWFKRNNPEFIQVCNYAGLDPDYVFEKAMKVKDATTEWMQQRNEQATKFSEVLC